MSLTAPERRSTLTLYNAAEPSTPQSLRQVRRLPRCVELLGVSLRRNAAGNCTAASSSSMDLGFKRKIRAYTIIHMVMASDKMGADAMIVTGYWSWRQSW